MHFSPNMDRNPYFNLTPVESLHLKQTVCNITGHDKQTIFGSRRETYKRFIMSNNSFVQ